MARPFGTRQSEEARRKIGIGSRRAWREQKKCGLVNRGGGPTLRAFYASPEGNLVKRSIAKKVKKSWQASTRSRRCRRMSLAKKGVAQTPEAIEARAKAIRQLYKDGKHPGGGPNGWHRCEYSGIVLSSSYELAFAKWCDRNKIKWMYQPRRFNLVVNGTYRPDFFLPRYNFWIEVKGAMMSKPMAKYFELKTLYPECPIALLDREILSEVLDRDLLIEAKILKR